LLATKDTYEYLSIQHLQHSIRTHHTNARSPSAGCGYYLLYQAFEKSQKELEKKIDALAKAAQK
ncbi:MAG: hypothetical protein VXW72_05550, partial [Candidatus Thermoplasmatota archaeon]|nr:hypothetical protein [Candidatus Thermoplasmatota archaeon]